VSNSISIDVEDYYHARNIELAIGRPRWSSLESRVRYSTEKILSLLSRNKVKGTFFVLGTVARKDKDLVRQINSEGHEIGSHGFRHHLAYDQSEAAFYKDICYSRKLLQDLSGQEVKGYRAPNFSIRDQNLWAYDALTKAGYKYDSSLYPVYHPRYDNRDKPLSPFIKETENGKLVIVPLATLPLKMPGFSWRLGIAGGAYWRIFPHFLIRYGLRKIAKAGQHPAICYLHPWEVDEGQPVFDELEPLQRFRHYYGVKKLEKKIDRHLKEFSWTTIENIVDGIKDGN